ncbi:MAG: hypothetical protein ABSE72_01430 [Bacteroidales bacterium]
MIRIRLLNFAGDILPVPGGLMTVVETILFRNMVMAFKNSSPLK